MFLFFVVVVVVSVTEINNILAKKLVPISPKLHGTFATAECKPEFNGRFPKHLSYVDNATATSILHAFGQFRAHANVPTNNIEDYSSTLRPYTMYKNL